MCAGDIMQIVIVELDERLIRLELAKLGGGRAAPEAGLQPTVCW